MQERQKDSSPMGIETDYNKLLRDGLRKRVEDGGIPTFFERNMVSDSESDESVSANMDRARSESANSSDFVDRTGLRQGEQISHDGFNRINGHSQPATLPEWEKSKKGRRHSKSDNLLNKDNSISLPLMILNRIKYTMYQLKISYESIQAELGIIISLLSLSIVISSKEPGAGGALSASLGAFGISLSQKAFSITFQDCSPSNCEMARNNIDMQEAQEPSVEFSQPYYSMLRVSSFGSLGTPRSDNPQAPSTDPQTPGLPEAPPYWSEKRVTQEYPTEDPDIIELKNAKDDKRGSFSNWSSKKKPKKYHKMIEPGKIRREITSMVGSILSSLVLWSRLCVASGLPTSMYIILLALQSLSWVHQFARLQLSSTVSGAVILPPLEDEEKKDSTVKPSLTQSIMDQLGVSSGANSARSRGSSEVDTSRSGGFQCDLRRLIAAEHIRDKYTDAVLYRLRGEHRWNRIEKVLSMSTMFLSISAKTKVLPQWVTLAVSLFGVLASLFLTADELNPKEHYELLYDGIRKSLMKYTVTFGLVILSYFLAGSSTYVARGGVLLSVASWTTHDRRSSDRQTLTQETLGREAIPMAGDLFSSSAFVLILFLFSIGIIVPLGIQWVATISGVTVPSGSDVSKSENEENKWTASIPDFLLFSYPGTPTAKQAARNEVRSPLAVQAVGEHSDADAEYTPVGTDGIRNRRGHRRTKGSSDNNNVSNVSAANRGGGGSLSWSSNSVDRLRPIDTSSDTPDLTAYDDASNLEDSDDERDVVNKLQKSQDKLKAELLESSRRKRYPLWDPFVPTVTEYIHKWGIVFSLLAVVSFFDLTLIPIVAVQTAPFICTLHILGHIIRHIIIASSDLIDSLELEPEIKKEYGNY